LAERQDYAQAKRQKLKQALSIFVELNMPRERDAIQAELNKADVP
jgi:hypothetical protein